MNSLKGDEGKIEFKSEQGNVWHLRQESQSWCEREACVRLSAAAHASTPKQAKLQGQSQLGATRSSQGTLRAREHLRADPCKLCLLVLQLLP